MIRAALLGIMAALTIETAFAQELPVGNPIVTPPQVNVTNTTVLQVPPMDRQVISDGSAIANQSLVVNTIQPVPVQWVNELCNLPNIWTTTPTNVTIGFPDLRDLAGIIQLITFALSGIALAACGLATMFGADVHERMGRIAFAGAMSIGNLIWWEWGIGINNSINGVLSPPDVCGTLIRPHIELATPTAGSDIAAPALVIVYAVVSLLLLVSLAFRLGMLDVLIAMGSLAEMCWADPHTEHVAQWYQRLAFGTLFGQILLVIGLRAARAMSTLGTGIGATILAIVIILICRKLLSVLSSQHHERSGMNTGRLMFIAARRLITKVI